MTEDNAQEVLDQLWKTRGENAGESAADGDSAVEEEDDEEEDSADR